MAGLTHSERLQPSLLDRLTDNEPKQNRESRLERIISQNKLRSLVLRDIGHLLNTVNLESTEELEDYPFVSDSVLNYGIPDLTGIPYSNIEENELAQIIKDALWKFESRLVRNTIQVNVVKNLDQMNNNAIVIEIEADLWANPLPLHLFLKTEIDLESGIVTIDNMS